MLPIFKAWFWLTLNIFTKCWKRAIIKVHYGINERFVSKIIKFEYLLRSMFVTYRHLSGVNNKNYSNQFCRYIVVGGADASQTTGYEVSMPTTERWSLSLWKQGACYRCWWIVSIANLEINYNWILRVTLIYINDACYIRKHIHISLCSKIPL